MAPSDAPSSPPTVMFFAANPASRAALDLDGEIRGIETELHTVGLGGVLRFVHRSATTPSTLQRALLQDRPVIVQFSGHGVSATQGGTAGILLQDDDGVAVKVVSREALGDLLSKAGDEVRVVFLNACYSAEQAAVLLAHVDIVIGMSASIGDRAAKVFAVAFYRALAFGRSVRAAFELAVNALMLEGLEADVALPTLQTSEGIDPAELTLVAAPKAANDPTWDVFISYAHADREHVYPLATALHRHQLRVFFDEWELDYGDVVQRRLEQGVRGSTHGLIAVSPTTMNRPWVEQEYAALLDKAVTQRRRLIPVLIGESEIELPPFLRTRRYVDLRGKSEAEFQAAVESIARALRGQRPGPPPRPA